MRRTTQLRFGLILAGILVLVACAPLPPLQSGAMTAQPTAGAATSTAAPTTLPATAAPVQPVETLQPPIEEVCNGMAQALSEALSRATGQATPLEVTVSEVAMNDVARGDSGAGCRALATGTGAQFSSPDTVVAAITAVLTGGGWVEDIQLQAGGPTGMGTGFRSGNLVALALAHWQPDAATTCPADQPISACEVAPEHQAYTITLDTAQAVGGTATP